MNLCITMRLTIINYYNNNKDQFNKFKKQMFANSTTNTNMKFHIHTDINIYLDNLENITYKTNKIRNR